MMLPGVEVARRRRVRAGQGRDGAYDGGVSRSETHRSRLRSAVTGARHHFRLGATSPATSHPQRASLLVREQKTPHEQQRPDTSPCSSAAATAICTSSNPNATENVVDTHDGRPFPHHHHHNRSEEEIRRSKFSCLLKGNSSCCHSDPGDVAMEARNRLDDLLQVAAAHATHRKYTNSSSRGPNFAQSSQGTTSFIYLNGHHLQLQESRRRTSVYNLLATWALAVKQCLNRGEDTSSRSMRRSRTSRSSSTASRASELSEAVMIMGGAKQSDQEDCPVCLEGLMGGETTITLRCNHTFHPHCLNPWLWEHGKCPCCRASIIGRISDEEELNRALLGGEALVSWVEAIIVPDS